MQQPPASQAKRIVVVFFRTSAGGEPVREWLKNLAEEDRKQIGINIKTVEFGWPLGMPTCKALGGGLWEVRSSLKSGRIARVLFMVQESCMVLLHGFIKKSEKLPQADLLLARKNKAVYENAKE